MARVRYIICVKVLDLGLHFKKKIYAPHSLYTLGVDKNKYFLTPFPPNLVHVVIECPQWIKHCFCHCIELTSDTAWSPIFLAAKVYGIEKKVCHFGTKQTNQKYLSSVWRNISCFRSSGLFPVRWKWPIEIIKNLLAIFPFAFLYDLHKLSFIVSTEYRGVA